MNQQCFWVGIPPTRWECHIYRWFTLKDSNGICSWLVVWNMFECFHILEVIIPTDFNFSEGYVYHQPVYLEKSENYSSEPPDVWVSKSYTLRPVEASQPPRLKRNCGFSTLPRLVPTGFHSNPLVQTVQWFQRLKRCHFTIHWWYKLSKYGWFMLIYPLVNKHRPWKSSIFNGTNLLTPICQGLC